MGVLHSSDFVEFGHGEWAYIQVKNMDYGRAISVGFEPDGIEGVVIPPDVAEAYAQKILKAVQIAREDE